MSSPSRRRRRVVAASLSVPASDSISSPVSSPVVAAPSSRRRVITPRLYPHRQPVRAPCRSSLCGRRVVVAVARKTIFSKYHYEFTCHVLHPKSTALFTPPFTALVAASISGSRPARRMRCRGRGPRTRNTLACIPIPGPLPSPHREAQPAIGVRVGVDRGGGLPGWFFGRQGEDQSEDRSEDLRRIGVRIVGGGGPRAVVPRRRVRIVPASSSPRRPRHRRRRRNRQHPKAPIMLKQHIMPK